MNAVCILRNDRQIDRSKVSLSILSKGASAFQVSAKLTDVPLARGCMSPRPLYDSNKFDQFDHTWRAGGGRARRSRVPRRRPLLSFTYNLSGRNKGSRPVEKKLLGSRTAIARKADTLRRNLQDLIDRIGIERMGFMTLTFKDNIRDRKLAEKRFHSFEIHILSKLGVEYIAVPERQKRGAIHYHLAVAFPFDIRSGFDLEACSEANLVKRHGYLGDGKWATGHKERYEALERIYHASANSSLRGVWRLIRQANTRTEKRNRKAMAGKVIPPFGRCETLPILSNAQAITFYVGTYITSQTEQRLPEDKGMRSVRYSLKIRNHLQSFQFAEGGNLKWRKGCKVLSALLLIHDEPIATREGNKLVFHYPKDHVRSRFGSRWPHRLAPWIFACYDSGEVCLKFAQTLPAEMNWQERLAAVKRFVDRLRGTTPWTPPRQVEANTSDSIQTMTATSPMWVRSERIEL